MKKAIGVQVYPWEEIRYLAVPESALQAGDKVIVRTEIGTEMGTVKFPEKEIKIDGEEYMILRQSDILAIK